MIDLNVLKAKCCVVTKRFSILHRSRALYRFSREACNGRPADRFCIGAVALNPQPPL